MDEPTSALNETEVEHLFALIDDLKAQGVGIVYITHKMDEVKRIADRITVMRDGQTIETLPAAGTSMSKIISLMVGLASVLLSVALGVGLGLVAGFFGGALDAFIMRLCDVMLSFPAILVALLIAGVGRAMFPNADESLAFGVLIISISLTGWVQYARTVRGSTMVERGKEYVQAARVTGVAPVRIMARHVLPNVLGPVLVLATIQVATAILTEATLSFLGVGSPPTAPSLGTLIRVGNDYLFSGEWWITVFPGAMLVVIALSVNLLGDWLRDALNPRLR